MEDQDPSDPVNFGKNHPGHFPQMRPAPVTHIHGCNRHSGPQEGTPRKLSLEEQDLIYTPLYPSHAPLRVNAPSLNAQYQRWRPDLPSCVLSLFLSLSRRLLWLLLFSSPPLLSLFFNFSFSFSWAFPKNTGWPNLPVCGRD